MGLYLNCVPYCGNVLGHPVAEVTRPIATFLIDGIEFISWSFILTSIHIQVLLLFSDYEPIWHLGISLPGRKTQNWALGRFVNSSECNSTISKIKMNKI
jgi:hypothetical protein